MLHNNEPPYCEPRPCHAIVFIKAIRYSYDPVTQSHTIFPDLGTAETKPALDCLMKVLAGYSEKRRLEFINLWEALTQNQKKTLRLVALKNGRDLFSAASLQMVGLNRASQVTRAIEALLTREVIEKNKGYHLQDILLKKWILSGL